MLYIAHKIRIHQLVQSKLNKAVSRQKTCLKNENIDIYECYIYAKGTKMANFTTKKNQHKNINDVQDSPPPYCHTIANVPCSCNKRP